MKISKYLITAAFFFCIMPFSFSQKPVPSANEVLAEAKAEAARSHKNVFIIFHASWCVWCHRMDTAMNEGPIKPLFEKSYVIRHLTVDESEKNKELENPGAAALRTAWHGDEQGIPYWIILDKDGKLLADSRITDENGKQGNNVGCPAQPDEVAYFIRVLQKTTALNPNELDKIRERFLKIGAHVAE